MTDRTVSNDVYNISASPTNQDGGEANNAFDFGGSFYQK